MLEFLKQTRKLINDNEPKVWAFVENAIKELEILLKLSVNDTEFYKNNLERIEEIREIISLYRNIYDKEFTHYIELNLPDSFDDYSDEQREIKYFYYWLSSTC